MEPRSLPLLTRVEWHLSRSRYAAWAIEHLIHKPLGWIHRRRPAALAAYERQVFSQNGDDGILAEIFHRIGATNRYAVEFGASDGHECCTRRLMVEGRWGGLLMDGNPVAAARAASLHAGRKDIVVRTAMVRVDNVLDLFAENSVPREPDLLVVDVDGNDYWILERILSAHRPRALCVEYNARWAPPTKWIMPYDPWHTWDGTAIYGASLASLDELARTNGYSLVSCDSRGVNAFFVRSEDAHRFEPRSAAEHYAPPSFGRRGTGHPLRMRPPK
jgi:hypothetical protein